MSYIVLSESDVFRFVHKSDAEAKCITLRGMGVWSETWVMDGCE